MAIQNVVLNLCIGVQIASALAEAEVEYQEKQSIAIDVRFKVIDETSLLERFASGQTYEKKSPIYMPIWTTTPWTLPANQAVALHPDYQYVLVECLIDENPERLIVAKDLLEEIVSRYDIKSHQILATYLLFYFSEMPFQSQLPPINFTKC